jgi:2-polyprenyl-3-methyl-5-hydroxy-6-metoxy-1,4-benzoquinol methylase
LLSAAPEAAAGLRARSAAAERMDTDCADFEEYRRCLADLAQVNAVTLTHRPTLAWLARESRGLAAFSLLDVGCGQGDLLRRIERWVAGRGIAATLIGLDRHPWSTRAAALATRPEARIEYVTADLFALDPPKRFDFIVSSQFMHHLSDQQAVTFIQWQEVNAARGWFVADLRRHWFAYRGFPLLARAARWHHFVRTDGQISIARAFLPEEMRALAVAAGIPPEEVEIRRELPFRITLAHRCTPP